MLFGMAQRQFKQALGHSKFMHARAFLSFSGSPIIPSVG
jgi:hypothetical protein